MPIDLQIPLRWFGKARTWMLGPREPVRIEGACKMRGNCCRNLILVDRGRPLASLRRFRRLARREAEFEMFVPREEAYEDGFLRFTCSNLGGDGRCQIYSERPDFCREYPIPEMFRVGGELLPGCGYRVVRGAVPEEPFTEVLERVLEGHGSTPELQDAATTPSPPV